jgi:hypothetical protein
MKKWLNKQILIFLLIALLLIPQISIAEDDIVPNGSIKIDNHVIYIYQKNDLKTLEIEEYYYINNTGNTSFNNTFNIWIPNNGSILAFCCDDTSNMACRYDENEEMWCFYFNKTDDENIYVGYPISSENKLSYYGQRESFTVTTYSTTNTSLGNDTLLLNVTLGGSYITRENDSLLGRGIHITSDNREIGITPFMAPYELFNITGFENIQVYNNGSDNETIEFIINDLPEGWNVDIWYENKVVKNISVSPQKYKNLTLIITAPSYLAKIYVGSEIPLRIEENEKRGEFSKKYLYDSKIISYNIYSFVAEGLEVSNDLISIHDEAYLLEEYGMYWYFSKAENVTQNNASTVYIGIEIPAKEINLYLVILLVVVLILIIIMIILIRKDYFKEKSPSQSKIPTNKNIEDKTDEKTEKEKKEKQIKELEKQKKQVLSAIKRVEQEFKNELISKEDYKRLRSTYKKRAVDILKEIDILEDNENE